MNNYTITLRSGKTENVAADTATEQTKGGQEWLVLKAGDGIVAKYAMDTVQGYRKE